MSKSRTVMTKVDTYSPARDAYYLKGCIRELGYYLAEEYERLPKSRYGKESILANISRRTAELEALRAELATLEGAC